MTNLFSQLLNDHKGFKLLIKGPITLQRGLHHRVTHGSEVVRLLGVRWSSFPSYLLDENHDNGLDPIHDTQSILHAFDLAIGNPRGPEFTNEFNIVDVILHEGESRERRILLHVHSSDVELL